MDSLTKNRQPMEIIIKLVQRAFGDTIKAEEIAVSELTEGFFNVAYEIELLTEVSLPTLMNHSKENNNTRGNTNAKGNTIVKENSDTKEVTRRNSGTGKKVILKIAPPRNSKVMTYEQNMMKAEVEALRLVKAKTTVPVPEVYYYDASHSLCDTDYFFMEKLEGESYYKLKCNGMPEEEQRKVTGEIGRLNAEMNHITGTSFGYLGLMEKQGPNWRDTFLSMIEEILEDGKVIDISIGMDYKEVWELIMKASSSLEEVKTPTFIHWDLWDGNVFYREGRITGIIDYERAIWADPLMEYYFRAHSYNPDFTQGYGSDLRKAAPVRALMYDIYLYLIMVIETKYRMYSDDWQYNFATTELLKAVTELKGYYC